MNLFTDNVPTLAVQAPIIREVPKVFCPTAVYSMDIGVVNRIAGETEGKIMERDAIMRRLATLEKGALICKQYAKRPHQSKHHQSLLYKLKLRIPVPSFSSDESGISELLVPRPRTPGNDGSDTPGKQPSHKGFPESVNKAGSTSGATTSKS